MRPAGQEQNFDFILVTVGHLGGPKTCLYFPIRTQSFDNRAKYVQIITVLRNTNEGSMGG